MMNIMTSVLFALWAGVQAGSPPIAAPAQVPAPAQTPVAAGTAQGPAPNRAAIEAYVIGPHDSLAITVVGEDELNKKYPVDEGGMINFPYVGRIQAGGLTIVAFQEQLKQKLANGYLNHPQILVDIDQYKSQSVNVLGAVRNPGEIQVSGQLTLLTALSRAGSTTADAGDEVQIAHNRGPIDPNGSQSVVAPRDEDVIHVKLRDLTLGSGDVLLRDGDIVYVPPAKHFTMTGSVRNAGSYVWEAGLTVDQAIARAGGLTERGSNRNIHVRRVVNGKMTEKSIGREEKILPDDTIDVGNRMF